jgi:hypothetical protein
LAATKEGWCAKKEVWCAEKEEGCTASSTSEKCDNNNGVNLEFQECNAIVSFTQLLTAPPCDEDDLF